MIPSSSLLLIAYLLGAIPFGYLLVKWKTGADVRASGSGNIGATNVLRTTGRAAGMPTLLLDIAKGYLAVWIAGRLTDHSALWMSAAALAVMAGHAYPVFEVSRRESGGQLRGRVPLPHASASGCDSGGFRGGGGLDPPHLHGLDRCCGYLSAGRLADPASLLLT